MTPIEMIPSSGIRAALAATDDTYATKVGTYEHPAHPGEADYRVTLWLLPCGEFALETNAEPIFETNHDDFAATCAEYDIELEAVGGEA